MTRRSFGVIWFISASALILLLPLATHSQSPLQQPQLTAAEENDSCEIYSMLLKTEMPTQWKIATWTIQQETQTFPVYGASNFSDLDTCLKIPPAQETIYRPIFLDYNAKNKKPVVLERKFDLPSYILIGRNEISTAFKSATIFHLSAVGFSPDGIRALVL